jgi:hypothetical protein
MLQSVQPDAPVLIAPTARSREVLRTALVGLMMFAAFCVLLALVQYGTPDLADNDGYYHIKMGELMRQQGLRIDFIWLPMSILNEHSFYDHHMLFHAYMALFVGDGSPTAMLLGAKISAIVMPALAFTAIWWFLRGQNVPWAAAWALGLCAVSEAFLYRMSIPRAQSASLLVLALALHWLMKRRYALLIPLGFVYVWLYNAFPLLMILALAEAGAALLTERRIAWRGPVFALIGIVLGLVISPYFPGNIVFIFNHLLPKLGQPDVSVGNEWYPYDTWQLVTNTGGALAVWALGMFAMGWRGRRVDRAILTSFLLSLVFAFMLLKARRFVEYFPAFALIFAALSAGPALQTLLADIRRGPQPDATGVQPIINWPRWAAKPIAALCILALLATLGLAIRNGRAAMATSRPSATYAEASAWLVEHTPARSMIFQTDWDDFPRLFFYNSTDIYTAGLDPTYMQLYDPKLYDEWVQITRGKVDLPGAIIRDRFGAHYILTDLDHEAFLAKAKADPLLHEVYRDRYAVIYTVDNK